MNRIKTGIKLQVTPEESKQVQEICFANDISWKSGSKKVLLEHKQYLIIRNSISWDSRERYLDKNLEEVNASLFIRTLGTCVEETREQELKQNTKKEEIMEKNEVESYADVKEYLIAKGLYEDVLSFNIDFNEYSPYFGNMFWYNETPQGHEFWAKINSELVRLKISDKIDEILEDYKVRNLEAIETKPPEKPKQYLCYVQGKSLPKHIHKTLEQAKQEAQRLCRKELAKVSVLEVVAEYEAEVLVKEVL